MRADGREQAGTGGNGQEQTGTSRPLSPVPARSRLFQAVRQLFGMPDYVSYCRHFRTHHPDRPLPSEGEFFDQFVRARYGDGPTRCC
jgi:uncharacterized short protein YbdD (DUF466 family)